jgi:hypothetical protein
MRLTLTLAMRTRVFVKVDTFWMWGRAHAKSVTPTPKTRATATRTIANVTRDTLAMVRRVRASTSARLPNYTLATMLRFVTKRNPLSLVLAMLGTVVMARRV